MAKIIFNEGILNISKRALTHSIAKSNNCSYTEARNYLKDKKVLHIEKGNLEPGPDFQHYNDKGELITTGKFIERECVIYI